MTEVRTKFKVGRYLLPVILVYTNGRIEINFGFSRDLIAEVKSMEGHKWHGYEEVNPRKIWSVKDSPRNAFRILHLEGKNPYSRYDTPIPDPKTNRPLYDHQRQMVGHALVRRYSILACEMGCLGPDHKLTDAITDVTRSVASWMTSKGLPTLKAYDSSGAIVIGKVSRIITKRTRRIYINDMLVGEDHLFLTGKLCFKRAKNLTLEDTLLIDASSGMKHTSRIFKLSSKPTGLGFGMETVQYICKTATTAARLVSKTLDTSSNLPETLTALRIQLQENLSSLESLGLRCQLSQSDSSQNCRRDSIGISFGDSMMLTEASVCTTETSLQLFATLQKISSNLSRIYLGLESSQGTIQIRFRSTVEDVFKTWAITYTGLLRDFFAGRLIDFEKPGRFILGRESEHLIPATCQNFAALEISSIKEAPVGTVYDVTMPKLGNYFDAAGINHQNTGKSLAFIETLDHIKDLESHQIWYIGPKSGVKAVRREFIKWSSKFGPEFMTYQGLVKRMREWEPGEAAPRVVCLA